MRIYCHSSPSALVEKIDALLPQTQCGQCGYPGCKPYAIAIAGGEADINLCPPGGEAGVKALAELLEVEPKPLKEAKEQTAFSSVALIDESKCIGCTLCIQVCPVDAILGASKFMHTVIASECTGCERCIAPCPVDCISMQPSDIDSRVYPQAKKHSKADNARARFETRQHRLEQERHQREEIARRKKEMLEKNR